VGELAKILWPAHYVGDLAIGPPGKPGKPRTWKSVNDDKTTSLALDHLEGINGVKLNGFGRIMAMGEWAAS